MTSLEKRRSGRKSGKHRKHSNASSSGSYLDDTDQEVSSLTDRAFRSLCIGDEAIYNDSDLCTSSPGSHRDIQRALGQSAPHGLIEDREELKRAAHESFSIRMQQYGQEFIHGGTYGTQVHGEPQWEVYGERTQVSATFQQSFVETSRREDKQLSFVSNGAKELSVQQGRSRSRVSSLIQAFNSDGYADGGGMDEKMRDRSEETAWERSAVVGMSRDLSEYQQNHYGSYFPPASAYPYGDTNVYSAMPSPCEASFMRSSHSKHSVAAHANSNFFMHSEFSPFKVWKDHNRFPFQQGEVTGFMQRSEFSKWYETPMYKSISLEPSMQGQYRFAERGMRHVRNNLAPVIPALPLRSTSTSMMPPALTVEKRCESELAVQYPHRKRAESIRGNRFHSQRPSTASPNAEMSRRVQDTISSVKALQHKIKMMSEQNLTTAMPTNDLDVLQGNNGLFPCGSGVISAGPAGGNTHTTTFNTGQVCAPLVYPHHETEPFAAQQQLCAVSPELVEHAPVRAESRGATPDVRISSYRSRATSLLFNLKDNRKRVKSTYSPTKFKGSEVTEKNRQKSAANEPLDTAIDIPYCSNMVSQFPQTEEISRTQSSYHQQANQYQRTGLSQPAVRPQPAIHHSGYPESTTDRNHAALTQSEMVDYSGQPGFMPENCPSNQRANGQNLQEDPSSFTSYRQEATNQAPGNDAYTHKAHHTAREPQRSGSEINSAGEYPIRRASARQQFNEAAGNEFTRVDKYQQLQEDRHYHSSVSSKERLRQRNNQDTENISIKAATTPWKQETLKGDIDQVLAYQKEAAVRDGPSLRSDEYGAKDQQTHFAVVEGTSKNSALVNPNSLTQLPQYVPLGNSVVEAPLFYGQQLSTALEDIYTTQNNRNGEQNKIMSNSRAKSDQILDQEPGKQPNSHSKKEKTLTAPQTDQSRAAPRGNEIQSPCSTEGKAMLESNMRKSSPFNPENTQTWTNQTESEQFVEVEGSESRETLKEQHTQAELARPHNRAQVELPRATSDRLILAEQARSEKVKGEHTNVEPAGFEKIDKTENMENTKTKEKLAEQSVQLVEQLTTKESRVHNTAPGEENVGEETAFRHKREARGEQVKGELARADRLKEEHIKSELVETKLTKIKHDKSQEARAEKNRPKQVGEELVKKEAENLGMVRSSQEKEMAQIKVKKRRSEQNVEDEKKKAELKNTELAENFALTSESRQETRENPADMLNIKHVKNEPDKVERVKTELAKAKAELAKIKEKLRGDHRDSSIFPARVEKNKNDVQSSKNVTKSKEPNNDEQAVQKYQESRESVAVSRQSVTQANRGGDDYERLREKYGFTDYTSTNRQKRSAERKASSNNDEETQTLSGNRVEAVKDDKSKPKDDPENTSSVEESGDYSSTTAKTENADSGDDKVKKGHSESVEKCNPVKQIDLSKQRDADQVKPLNADRKSKWSEQSADPSRPLTHKERAQTKQEILTSKIKAHAEKEISAIKGSAIRDGLISKNFIKPSGGSQRPEIQMPPARQASNKQENPIPSKMLPNLQMEAVRPVSPQTSATMPLAHTEIDSQMKVSTPDRWMGMTSVKTQEASVETHTSEPKQAEEATQSREENSAENSIHHMKNDSSARDLQKIEAAENMRAENEACNEDSEPSLQLVFGPTDTGVSDHSLQIMGIMVTVRERKQSLDTDLGRDGEQMNPGEQEGNCLLANSLLQLSQEDGSAIVDEPSGNIHHQQESSVQMTEDKTDQQVLVKRDRIVQDAVEIINEKVSSQQVFSSQNPLAKIVHSARVTAQPAIKDKTKSSMELDTTAVINPSSHSSASVTESPAVEWRRDDLMQTKANTAESKNTDTSPRPQQKEERTGENLEEQCVHMDNIAIQVLQTATTEGKNAAEKCCDVTGDGENKQVATSRLDKTESDDAARKLAPAGSRSSRNRVPKEITVNCDDAAGKSEKLESEMQQMQNYFYVQSAEEAGTQAQTSTKTIDTCDALAAEDPTPSNKGLCNESANENTKDLQKDTVDAQHVETDSLSARPCNKTDVDQSARVKKRQTENQPASLARERQSAPRQTVFQEKPEVKPKTKERTSTIPEISAIADYARLKVIVSGDRDDTIQEFPPNKKEGFFPLIQSRHSRRPAYAVDPHALTVKEEKSLSKKTKVGSKVTKEPKPLVFPITEKEHQRTGMFKLGDKDKQEKTTNEKTPEQVEEGEKPKSIYQPNIPSVQTTTSSANRTEQTSASLAKQVDELDPNEKIAQTITYNEAMPYFDQISKPQMQEVGKKKESTPRKTANVHEEGNPPEKNKPVREDKASGWQAETEENIRIKQMIEESRASLAEEAQRNTQREVERRAHEREAIAKQIKERRQKQKEAERKAEEEEIAKQKQEETKMEEERLAKQRQEEMQKMKESMREKQQQHEMEVHKRHLQAAEEEQQRRSIQRKGQRGPSPDQPNRKVAVVGDQKGFAQGEEQPNGVVSPDEPQRRAAKEVALKTGATLEGQMRPGQDKWQRQAAQAEQQQRAAPVTQSRGAAQEEENPRKAARERRVPQKDEVIPRQGVERSKASQDMEQLRRAAEFQEQQLRLAVQEEQLRRAAREKEQKRTAAIEEQQKSAAREEQHRRAAQEEEHRKRAAKEEQQRRAAQKEQQRRAAWEEEQRRRAADEEQLRRAMQEEEDHRRAVREEEQRRKAAHEEQLRRAAQKEQQRRAAWEEELKRRAAEEEQLRRAVQEEEQRRRSALEEHLRKEEKQRMLAAEEQQRKATKEDQIKAAEGEEPRRDDHQKRVGLIDEEQKRTADHCATVYVEEKNKRNQTEESSIHNLEENLTRGSKTKAGQQTEKQRDFRSGGEARIKTYRAEENKRAVEKEKQVEGLKTNEARAEQKQVMQVKGDKAQEVAAIQREEEIRTQARGEDKERAAGLKAKEQSGAAQMVDALQYYTIASDSDRKGSERQRHYSPHTTRRANSKGLEAPGDPHHRSSRPSAPVSPAISLPRSNTSSPAVGYKPSMFLVKDNTSRGSSFLKSVKPRFHKNFGEDYRVGSPVWSETGEEEQEAVRQRATTPLHQDTGPNRLAAIREPPTLQLWQDTSVSHPHHHHRPFSRRSLALDEDDSRSVVSYMSEDVESFATSAADLSDIRSLYDYERPESSCSFSSDVCRSMGKPPVVPPKSEKALRRAKRLTTRRIKKELSRAVEDNTEGVEKTPQVDSRIPSSPDTEVHSPGRCAVATPHFSSPVSLAHTPKGESALLSSHAERQTPNTSQFAAPYPADPVTLPAAAAAAPVASPAAIATATAAPKIVADVSSPPTLHRTSHPAPVTKYHVESCYPGSYPVTQRKVLQDVGSGQYFVVDVPVPVKTKTFIDPQTGKYVQLNVRESTERGSQPQTLLQPQASVAPQQQPISQDYPVGKNLGLYRGYNGYPANVNSGPYNKQSISMTPYQNQQPGRGSHTYRHPASERVQNVEGSPERTPYMDTVSAAPRAQNTGSNTHGQCESFTEFSTNSHHLAGSSSYSNVNSGPSQCKTREIKSMSELDDFMEVSDW